MWTYILCIIGEPLKISESKQKPTVLRLAGGERLKAERPLEDSNKVKEISQGSPSFTEQGFTDHRSKPKNLGLISGA